MTTPHDARPVARLSLDHDGLGVYEDEKGDYVLFEDYDALRSEVERLRADCAAYAGIAVKLAAAEARIRAARKLTSNRFSVSATDIRAVLNDQVNALGDEGNG